MDWSPDQISELTRLWGEGLTTSEIGKRLGISKNAVVGKAHRLGLKGRPSPIKRQDVKIPVAKKPESRIFTLTDLSAQTCRWPIGTRTPGSNSTRTSCPPMSTTRSISALTKELRACRFSSRPSTRSPTTRTPRWWPICSRRNR